VQRATVRRPISPILFLHIFFWYNQVSWKEEYCRGTSTASQHPGHFFLIFCLGAGGSSVAWEGFGIFPWAKNTRLLNYLIVLIFLMRSNLPTTIYHNTQIWQRGFLIKLLICQSSQKLFSIKCLYMKTSGSLTENKAGKKDLEFTFFLTPTWHLTRLRLIDFNPSFTNQTHQL